MSAQPAADRQIREHLLARRRFASALPEFPLKCRLQMIGEFIVNVLSQVRGLIVARGRKFRGG